MTTTAAGGHGATRARTRTAGHSPMDWFLGFVRTLGELFITAGLLILLFVFYELYVTGIATQHAQSALKKNFFKPPAATAPGTAPAAAGASASATPAIGSGVAIIRSLRLGKDWNFVVVQGTATADLAKGPGHLLGTALPGEVGNTVISGHRTTHSHPFYNLNELQPGDAVVLETRTEWYVYRVTGTTIVAPTDIAVTYPVPDQKGAVPTQRLLTLTTCNPRYSASTRMIVHGILVSQQPLSAGNPAALTTGKA